MGNNKTLGMIVTVIVALAIAYFLSAACSVEDPIDSDISLGMAAEETFAQRAMVTIMVLNSSNTVLYDYADMMDMGAIDSLAQAHPNEPIPQEDLLGELPGPPEGWAWLIPGGQYISNGTSTSASGMYFKGIPPSFTELAQVLIHHEVGGISYEDGDYEEIPENITFDDGYPLEVTVQGYPGMELRASGGNLEGIIGDFNAESLGLLWVGIGDEIPIPEIGGLIGVLAVLVAMAIIHSVRAE